jgi:hypothetical protein
MTIAHTAAQPLLTWLNGKKSELHGAVAVNNYRMGVAERVKKDARDEKKREEKMAEETERKRLTAAVAREEAERMAELARLAGPGEPGSAAAVTESDDRGHGEQAVGIKEVDETPLPTERRASPPPPDSDSDSGDVDDSAGFGVTAADFNDDDDNDGENLIDFDTIGDDSAPLARAAPTPFLPPEPVISADPAASEDANPTWSSAIQLRNFCENAQSIAKGYLEAKGESSLHPGSGNRTCTTRRHSTQGGRMARRLT